MIKLTVLYDHPADAEKFDDHYLGTHTPLVQALPRLDRFEVARSIPGGDGAPGPYHLIAELYFPDAQALQSAMASPEGAALAADTPNVAGTKSTIFMSQIEA
jgi:uncharacterized protein (TIGR02118 family)